MQPNLVVVIVTYNSAKVIEALLDSLPQGLARFTAEVVVVDNGSTDGTLGILERRFDCRVIRSTNVGYAAGLNLGVRVASRADAILVLNPDVQLRAGAIPPLLEALHTPGTGIVAPQVVSEDGTRQMSLRREPSLLRALGLTRTRLTALSEYLSRPADYEHPRTVDWALGAALLLSRACYEHVGGFDESFFLYSEETDFCLRARDLGWTTRYQPTSVVMHIGGGSGESPTTAAMKSINRVRLYRRRHTLIRSWTYYWLTVCAELTWVVRGERKSRQAVVALLRPSRRPPQLGCSTTLLPR